MAEAAQNQLARAGRVHVPREPREFSDVADRIEAREGRLDADRQRARMARAAGRRAALKLADLERTGQTSVTVERIGHGGGLAAVETILGSDERGKTVKTQRIIAAPLDRCWREGSIVKAEFEAGDDYRSLAYLAAIDPAAPTVDWSAVVARCGSRAPSMFSAQFIADARIEWRDVEKRVHGVVKIVLDLALIREVSLREIGASVFGRVDPREAAVAGHAGFRVALGALTCFT